MAKRDTYLEALQMANVQRTRATRDMLFSKRKREATHAIETVDENGDAVVVEMLLRSISLKEYDTLVTANPPTSAQKKEGATYNLDTFAPQLISRVVVDPALTEDDAKALWRSEDWNRGELFSLFSKCAEVCNSGVDLGPTAADSE